MSKIVVGLMTIMQLHVPKVNNKKHQVGRGEMAPCESKMALVAPPYLKRFSSRKRPI